MNASSSVARFADWGERLGSLALVAGGIIATAFLHQSLVAWGPLERLVTHQTYDDTFLYLNVARNWGRTGTPSFDGVIPTNGFQPLWGIVTALVGLVVKENETLVRVVCQLGALLNLATGIALVTLGRALGDRRIGFIAAALFGMSMFARRSVTGMESELHGFVFCLSVIGTLHCLDATADELDRKSVLAAATFLTLNALSRLDSGLLSLGLGIAIAVKLARLRKLRLLAIFAATPALTFGVYAMLSLSVFSVMTPVSVRTKLYYSWEAQPRSLLDAVGFALTKGFERAGTLLESISQTHWLVGAVVVIGGLAARYRRSPGARVLTAVLALLLLHVFVMQLVLQRFAYAAWYYRPLLVVYALGLAHAVVLVPISRKTRYLSWIGVGLLSAACLASAVDAFGELDEKIDSRSVYIQRLRASKWLESTDELEPGAAIGAWNAGQLAFFAPSRRIVNLDGLVQSPDFVERVLRPNAWRAYLEKENIRYLVDYNTTYTGVEGRADSRTEPWDPSVSFRGILPLDRARVVRVFGTPGERQNIVAMDVRSWLSSGD